MIAYASVYIQLGWVLSDCSDLSVSEDLTFCAFWFSWAVSHLPIINEFFFSLIHFPYADFDIRPYKPDSEAFFVGKSRRSDKAQTRW